MDKKTISKRVSDVRRCLREQGVECLIVTDPCNITYVTGFGGHDSWVLLTGTSVWLITDSRYTEQAKDQCLSCKIYERTELLYAAAAKLLSRYKNVKTVAVEAKTAVSEFLQIKKLFKAKYKTTADIIETVRSVKQPGEVGLITKASDIAANALRKSLRSVKSGVGEYELAAVIDYNIRTQNGMPSFETIVAFGANASKPHHQPGKTRLKSRDTILIDFGARYQGYCSDITRCFCVGTPKAEYKKAYETVLAAQSAAIDLIRPGVNIKSVDAAAREVIEESGFAVFGHGTGHGIGLDVHELPVVSASNKSKLIAGHVVTIEPGIYIPGKLGIRIEDDVLVTPAGGKILSKKLPKSFETAII